MPTVSSDIMQLKINMPDGFSKERKLEIIKRAERAVDMLATDTEIAQQITTDKLTNNQLSFM